jgi:hypothetical protein
MVRHENWVDLLAQPDAGEKYRARVVKSLDVPEYLLGVFWKVLTLHGSSHDSVTAEEYASLLKSENFRFESEIRRDINRTYPNLKFFMEINSLGQAQLFNVLKAYSIHNPEVGYCQGMGFIVGMLLSHMEELDAFNVLNSLMHRKGDYNMQGLYKPGLPLLNEYLTKLDRMIHHELPILSDHFASLGVETSMFASQWILTLFVYNLEWAEAKKIFNLFLLFGIQIILKFSLYILHRSQTKLLTMGFEEVLGKVNDMTDVKVAEFMDWSRSHPDDNIKWDYSADDSSTSET